MKRYILTGSPGSGKTTLIEHLAQLGFPVVNEAATHVIACQQAIGIRAPWLHPDFIDLIVSVQVERHLALEDTDGAVSFFDRSPICTLALARHLGRPPSSALEVAVNDIATKNTYARDVFFVRSLGFVTPTAARTISFEEALVFEQRHVETYREHGYNLIMVEPGSVESRIASILAQT